MKKDASTMLIAVIIDSRSVNPEEGFRARPRAESDARGKSRSRSMIDRKIENNRPWKWVRSLSN
jgi:hypothetical protein